MNQDLVKIEQSLDSIDLRRIAEYTRKIMDLGDSFNKLMAPTYARDFIIAFDVASVMLAKTLQFELQAKAALEEAEAIAFLDRAPDYFKQKDEKPTVESKRAFVALDSDVKNAKEILGRATATVSLLKAKVNSFREAIQVVKSMQHDGYKTQWEGM